MSVFRKLVGFLFEEEEEIEEEGELEEVSVHEPYRTRAQSYHEESVQGKHAPMTHQKEPLAEPVREEAIMPQRKRQEKKFTTIDADTDSKPKPTSAKRPVVQRPEKRSVKRSEPVKKEFEFTPVISPIFGVDETTKDPSQSPFQNQIPPVRATIASAPRNNPLGTVLSPMYGASELEVFEEEAKERLENVEVMQEEAYASYTPEAEISYDDGAIEEEDLIRVPLEDLLGKEEISEQNDDLLQFSLFGDDEIVSTDRPEGTYTMKE